MSGSSKASYGKATNQREAIAYHEAGHAVISMKLGYKCLYVTIVPDGDRLGHVCGEDPLSVGRASKFQDAIKILVAASLSENKRFGLATWGDAEDRLTANKLALLACNHETAQAEALIDGIVSETSQLLEHHWPEIDALAQRLLTQGRVNFLDSEGLGTANPKSALHP